MAVRLAAGPSSATAAATAPFPLREGGWGVRSPCGLEQAPQVRPGSLGPVDSTTAEEQWAELAQAGQVTSLGDIPLIVLASARPTSIQVEGQDVQDAWLELQQELAALSSNGELQMLRVGSLYPVRSASGSGRGGSRCGPALCRRLTSALS